MYLVPSSSLSQQICSSNPFNFLPHNPDLNREAFGKHCWKKEKMLMTSISPFPTMFSTLLKTSFDFLFEFTLPSANGFNMDQSKILSFGKDLTHYHTMLHFDALEIYNCRNIVSKGQIACNKQCLHFHNIFYPIYHLFFHFKCILKCRLRFVSISTSLKFWHLVMS